MSVDRSLRLKSSLERHRNVLSRAERVTSLMEQDRWQERISALHLPKISHRKAKAKKKVKAEVAAAEGAVAAAEPGAPVAPAPEAKPKPKAKPK
jgi:small basic protein (TIGR04137 family)